MLERGAAGGLPIDRWQNLMDYPEDTFDLVVDSNLKVALQTSRVFKLTTTIDHVARAGAARNAAVVNGTRSRRRSMFTE